VDEVTITPGAVAATARTAVDKWTTEILLGVRPWTERMFSFVTSRDPAFVFSAGQFARLGVDDGEGGIVWRPHSMVSAPADTRLEFLTVVVPDGAFTQRLARLHPGDAIYVEKTPYGFLTADVFAGGQDLWLLASGTGLGPYVSILREAIPWLRYQNLLVVHSVKYSAELAYREELAKMATQMMGLARLRYMPVVTREVCAGALDQRIPILIENGGLEAAFDLTIDLERSRIMICGNPEMAKELRALLTGRGFRVNRRTEPGQLAFENYW
jgi:ferredoxin--NADP+ reductase